ncbi:MAG: curli assembly protein CsgF [Pseudomonadota bacterium]
MITRFDGAAIILLLSISSANVIAQELVYQPINPSFGGDPFNSSHLLSIANIDRPDPPQDETGFGAADESSQADFFVRQLESRILSRLSQDITDAIFGPDAEPSGTFQFDDTTIAFETLLDGTVQIEIADLTTGGVTQIDVPGFLAQGGQ